MLVFLSQKIRILRVQKGWSQKRLAQKTNLSQSTICRMEIDCSNVKVRHLFAVLQTLSAFNSDVDKTSQSNLEKYFSSYLGIKTKFLFTKKHKLSSETTNLLLACVELMDQISILVVKEKSKGK